MKLFLRLTCLFFLVNYSALLHADASLLTRPEVQAFLREMVIKYQFDENQLQQLFSKIELRADVAAKKAIPYSAKPWYQYEKSFVNPSHINEGLNFWRTHSKVLQQVEDTYGIPAGVIVAIFGVESSYGRSKLKYRAIDSLATLAFNASPRANYFSRELREFLLLTREQNLDPLSVKSSYDGGLGLPQFMPSSYRHYAVKIDGDNHSDLFTSIPDSIGSIANYLRQNGWQPGGMIALPAMTKEAKEWPYARVQPQYTLPEISRQGVYPLTPVNTTERANILTMAGEAAPQHWLIFNNFYAITRYNSSPMYALVVYQLSQQLTQRYKQETSYEEI